MKYILTNEYAHYFPKEYADIIISEFPSFNITKKFINKTVSGFGIGDYAIFIVINDKSLTPIKIDNKTYSATLPQDYMFYISANVVIS